MIHSSAHRAQRCSRSARLLGKTHNAPNPSAPAALSASPQPAPRICAAPTRFQGDVQFRQGSPGLVWIEAVNRLEELECFGPEIFLIDHPVLTHHERLDSCV